MQSKKSKRILKWIFEAQRVIVQKIIKWKRSGTPKLCWADQVKFEFWRHFEGQKSKKRKIAKKTAKSILAIFGRYWSQRAEILHSTLCHQYLHFCFHKFLCILHRSDNTKIAPTRRIRIRTTPTPTIPWSGLRRRQKYHYQDLWARPKLFCSAYPCYRLWFDVPANTTAFLSCSEFNLSSSRLIIRRWGPLEANVSNLPREDREWTGTKSPVLEFSSVSFPNTYETDTANCNQLPKSLPAFSYCVLSQ